MCATPRTDTPQAAKPPAGVLPCGTPPVQERSGTLGIIATWWKRARPVTQDEMPLTICIETARLRVEDTPTPASRTMHAEHPATPDKARDTGGGHASRNVAASDTCPVLRRSDIPCHTPTPPASGPPGAPGLSGLSGLSGVPGLPSLPDLSGVTGAPDSSGSHGRTSNHGGHGRQPPPVGRAAPGPPGPPDTPGKSGTRGTRGTRGTPETPGTPGAAGTAVPQGAQGRTRPRVIHLPLQEGRGFWRGLSGSALMHLLAVATLYLAPFGSGGWLAAPPGHMVLSLGGLPGTADTSTEGGASSQVVASAPAAVDTSEPPSTTRRQKAAPRTMPPKAPPALRAAPAPSGIATEPLDAPPRKTADTPMNTSGTAVVTGPPPRPESREPASGQPGPGGIPDGTTAITPTPRPPEVADDGDAPAGTSAPPVAPGAKGVKDDTAPEADTEEDAPAGPPTAGGGDPSHDATGDLPTDAAAPARNHAAEVVPDATPGSAAGSAAGSGTGSGTGSATGAARGTTAGTAATASATSAPFGYALTDVDTAPSARSKVPPDYPRRARRTGTEGRVVLRLLVREDGRPEHLTVVEAAPSGIFEESALEAVARWRFAPGTRKGHAVPTWVLLPVRFDLANR